MSRELAATALLVTADHRTSSETFSMTHPLILLFAALITGYSAFFYAKSKGGYWSTTLFGALAFLLPVSLPLITLYLMGRPVPAGGHVKPQLIVMLTIGNIIAVTGIIALLDAMATG